VRFSLLALSFALAACGRPDRSTPQASSTLASSATFSGPQALVLRIARAGGPPRVYSYQRLDSTVWASTDPAPTPSQVLAFDDENGSVAYEDTKGRPVLLELRLGTITVTSERKLTGLASANGSVLYGIAGPEVVRMTPTGEWSFKPAKTPKAVFPQNDGSLLIAIGEGANTRLLKLFPPDPKVLDSLTFPVAARTVRTQLGDRLYLAVDSGLVVLRTRTMDWAPLVPFTEPISVIAATPSGDRAFVLTHSRTQISVVDRFQDKVTGTLDLPGKAEDLRVDPLGRYLLARAADKDSIWVVAIGTERIIGGLKSTWRPDLPFVGYDGAVAVASGADVLLFDGETLKQTRRIAGGATDFWYPFLWDGFRPRNAALDEPARFDSVRIDTTATDTVAARDSAGTDTTNAVRGFIVSFAAFTTEDRAKELADRVTVGGDHARVVASTRDGVTIYRVILGPYPTKEDAEKAGKDSGHSYWVYEGSQ
jgi:hypothetical protein